MTTTGMAFFDMDLLNKSAGGAICIRCGFVHTFLADAQQWVDPTVVKPEDLSRDPLSEGASQEP